jgi:hypothetical protein
MKINSLHSAFLFPAVVPATAFSPSCKTRVAAHDGASIRISGETGTPQGTALFYLLVRLIDMTGSGNGNELTSARQTTTTRVRAGVGV